MFNHTQKLKANQACHFKITNQYNSGGRVSDTWKAAFSFAENDGIAVFIKNFPNIGSEGKFWTKDNTKVDDWKLLVSEEKNIDGG